jgi:DNA-binding transcriptional MerR regulator
MADPQLLSPHTVAHQLNISVNQLKRWTREFAAQLSASAVGSASDRYTAGDVKKLQTVKELLAQGKSAAEVATHLKNNSAANPNHHDPTKPTIVTAEEREQALIEAQQQPVSVLRDMLQGFAAGQEAILNSQQTNRSLLGVIIQDNFNLKEENTRLRERLLKLEQELDELRLHQQALNDLRTQQQDERRLIELRLRQLELKKDWLNRLLGI